MPAEIRLDRALLNRRNDEIGAVDLAGNSEPSEAHEGRTQVLDARVGDADLGLGDRGQPDERADLDVVGADPVRGSTEASSSIDRELVGPDPVNLRAERHEEMTQVLDVGLARRVAKNRRAAGRDGGDESILGSGDTRLVEEDVGTAKARR